MGPRFGIYYLTRDGRREMLAADPQLPCSQPIPVRPRPSRHVRPSQVDYRQTTGACYIQDVYAGPALSGCGAERSGDCASYRSISERLGWARMATVVRAVER